MELFSLASEDPNSRSIPSHSRSRLRFNIDEVQYLALCKYYSASPAWNSCVTLRKRHVLTFFLDESATWRSRDLDLVSRLKLKLSLRVESRRISLNLIFCEKLKSYPDFSTRVVSNRDLDWIALETRWIRFIVLVQYFYHLNVPSTHIEETNLISRDLNICARSWEPSIASKFYEENIFSSDFCVIERFVFHSNRLKSLIIIKSELSWTFVWEGIDLAFASSDESST